jgi:hypothetical protein
MAHSGEAPETDNTTKRHSTVQKANSESNLGADALHQISPTKSSNHESKQV